MSRYLAFLAGAGFGAAATYMLDPDRGGYRRGRFREGAWRGLNRTGHVLDHATSDVLSRTHGIVGEIRHLIHHAESPDAHLQEKIRSKVARITGHPESVGVTVRDGKVTLEGPVLKAAAHRLLASVQAMKGVKEVENLLEVRIREEPDPQATASDIRGFPALLPEDRDYPAPFLVLLASAGLALSYMGLRRRDEAGWAMAAGGAALLGPAAAAWLRRRWNPYEGRPAAIRGEGRYGDAKETQGEYPL